MNHTSPLEIVDYTQSMEAFIIDILLKKEVLED